MKEYKFAKCFLAQFLLFCIISILLSSCDGLGISFSHDTWCYWDNREIRFEVYLDLPSGSNDNGVTYAAIYSKDTQQPLYFGLPFTDFNTPINTCSAILSYKNALSNGSCNLDTIKQQSSDKDSGFIFGSTTLSLPRVDTIWGTTSMNLTLTCNRLYYITPDQSGKVVWKQDYPSLDDGLVFKCTGKWAYTAPGPNYVLYRNGQIITY